MTTRAACLGLALLTGCATATPEPGPGAGVGPALEGAPDRAARPGPAASAGPSDWALAIVGTPFVFAFRAVVCTASAVIAAPTAGLLILSEDPRPGLVYLRDGLAQNCGPPYGVPVPVASIEQAPNVGYAPPPDVGQPRALTRYSSAAVMAP
jgi:hypothetical protein